ncbi:MAG TPA: hypothetical protein VKJ45_27720 [Blastocatellia bacterium]|nr:hypothetical protein [Blastocatellia bacterium]
MELTFSELFQRWEVAIVPTIKCSTANYYLKLLRTHVIPTFGKMEIANI